MSNQPQKPQGSKWDDQLGAFKPCNVAFEKRIRADIKPPTPRKVPIPTNHDK